jgi:hypothetical protein
MQKNALFIKIIKMTFEPIYKQVIKSMQAEGRVTTLSKEDMYQLDHKFAMGLAPIKEEFHRKEKASRYYANKLESTTAEV